MRIAYQCDCSGPVPTDSCDGGDRTANLALNAIADWTGDRPDICPWRVFWDDYIGRVLKMWGAWKEGQLAIAYPRPSHREMEGVLHYDRVMAAIEVKQLEEERKNAESRRGG